MNPQEQNKEKTPLQTGQQKNDQQRNPTGTNTQTGSPDKGRQDQGRQEQGMAKSAEGTDRDDSECGTNKGSSCATK